MQQLNSDELSALELSKEQLESKLPAVDKTERSEVTAALAALLDELSALITKRDKLVQASVVRSCGNATHIALQEHGAASKTVLNGILTALSAGQKIKTTDQVIRSLTRSWPDLTRDLNRFSARKWRSWSRPRSSWPSSDKKRRSC